MLNNDVDHYPDIIQRLKSNKIIRFVGLLGSMYNIEIQNLV